MIKCRGGSTYVIYSSSVLKLAWNIHPSDSILQGHDTIVCLPTGHGKSPIFKCIRVLSTFSTRIANEGREATYSVLIVSLLLSLIKEQVKNFREHSLSVVRL